MKVVHLFGLPVNALKVLMSLHTQPQVCVKREVNKPMSGVDQYPLIPVGETPFKPEFIQRLMFFCFEGLNLPNVEVWPADQLANDPEKAKRMKALGRFKLPLATFSVCCGRTYLFTFRRWPDMSLAECEGISRLERSGVRILDCSNLSRLELAFQEITQIVDAYSVDVPPSARQSVLGIESPWPNLGALDLDFQEK